MKLACLPTAARCNWQGPSSSARWQRDGIHRVHRRRSACGSGAIVCSWSLLIRWAQRGRCQAEIPLIALFRFPRPALPARPLRAAEQGDEFAALHSLPMHAGSRQVWPFNSGHQNRKLRPAKMGHSRWSTQGRKSIHVRSTPLLGLVGNKFPEFGRRHWHRRIRKVG
jgi:hypothetical protein